MKQSVLGIGTDLVTITRIANVLERNGQRFVERILHPDELAQTGIQGVSEEARQVAKFFAAKEAVAKALGTGFREGVSWQDMVISRDSLGAPQVRLSGAAHSRMALLGGDRVLLSLSDEEDQVLAFAVLT